MLLEENNERQISVTFQQHQVLCFIPFTPQQLGHDTILNLLNNAIFFFTP